MFGVVTFPLWQILDVKHIITTLKNDTKQFSEYYEFLCASLSL